MSCHVANRDERTPHTTPREAHSEKLVGLTTTDQSD